MVGNRWVLGCCAVWSPCDASTSPVRLAAVALCGQLVTQAPDALVAVSLRGQLVTQAPDALAAVALCGQLLTQLT